MNETLTFQLGPITGHAQGGLAVVILLGITLVYVLGPAIVSELVRRISARNSEQ
jgi:hypothetical protein